MYMYTLCPIGRSGVSIHYNVLYLHIMCMYTLCPIGWSGVSIHYNVLYLHIMCMYTLCPIGRSGVSIHYNVLYLYIMYMYTLCPIGRSGVSLCQIQRDKCIILVRVHSQPVQQCSSRHVSVCSEGQHIILILGN